ncbi:MAG: ABC transporter permease [Chloroflexi bacterium]|nr:ABC transporter permease [Chloroflexota bacterium]
MDRTVAIAVRVVRQILRDRRSVALIIIAPLVVMSLVGFSFRDQPAILNQAAPALVGVFALIFTFMLTAVSFLRERAQGTLERLLVTPVGRGDLLVGYLLGFLLFAAVQSVLLLLFTIFVFDISYQGELWQVFVVLMVLTVVGVNLGVFVSTFANNEFQVVQFIPILLAPQIFLSGVILPVSQMPGYFQALSKAFPLTYAIRALRNMMLRGESIGDNTFEVGLLAAFAVGLLLAASATVRRS